MTQRQPNGKFAKGNKEGHRFTSTAQPDPKKVSEGRRKQIAEDNTLSAICTAICQSETPEKARKAYEELGFDASTKIKALFAKLVSLGLSKNASIRDVIALIQLIAEYTNQKPANKSMLVDGDGNGINPFDEIYRAICGEKDYTR